MALSGRWAKPTQTRASLNSYHETGPKFYPEWRQVAAWPSAENGKTTHESSKRVNFNPISFRNLKSQGKYKM